MKILNVYRNGNYNVMICDDGTKMRFNNESHFIPTFPESIDMKITNQCPYGCPFCHENSTPDGKAADLIVKNNGDKIKNDELENISIKDIKLKYSFFDTLVPGTEVAIGGGAVTTHPQLRLFLELLHNKGIIANMTVNERELWNNSLDIFNYMRNGLINGLGISFVSDIEDAHVALNDFIQKSKTHNMNNVVIHIIAGVADENVIKYLRDRDLKVLILGYKHFRKGNEYCKENNVDENIKYLKENLKSLIDHGAFETISFDNLAISQLNVQGAMNSDTFKSMYMGDDGQFTMYIDLPNNVYAYSSIAPLDKRHQIEDDIKNMFVQVRNDAKT